MDMADLHTRQFPTPEAGTLGIFYVLASSLRLSIQPSPKLPLRFRLILHGAVKADIPAA
jgi:hypothetical protein